ncbi:DUF7088 domain-containing protein [Mycolicibacterium gadium]|uniref:DUF7088 domain-containing protein n=1 Tax=Mycolicibacterium gadium TaxID=1794 RepID=A0A7I7WJ79_MYCGU|nr:Gldg family protein [Mycolicibacterium gadium]BBZ15898.1 hypothetical protein MGAD_02330 [Mycolicibacterium gadium]
MLVALMALAALAAAAVTLDDERIDLSTGRTFTLSAETRELLGRVDDPVTIALFFAREQPGYNHVADLARRFADTGDNVRITFQDPNGEQAFALNVASGAVVVSTESGGQAVVRIPDEEELAAALAEASSLPEPQATPNTAPSQPLYPTTLGRALLLWLPAVAAPAVAAIGGLAVAYRRRRG